jgi:hypothetical protein
MRKPVADMFNAQPEEIFFGGAASTILSIFSTGIKLKENANIIVSGQTFPSTAYTWMNIVGEENVRIARPENGRMPAEKLFELVDENTAVISLCSVENTTGFRHDLKELSAFCQEKGIYLVLDITQGVASMKIDVQETPVDFMVSSTFKWLGGLFGFGFGYASKRVLDKINPVQVGWTGNKNRMDHSKYVLNLSDDANKFETGMLNWESLRSLEEAIKLYMEMNAMPFLTWDRLNKPLDEITDEEKMAFLKEDVYGRCAYDNLGDLVDRQSVLVSFKNGSNCAFTLIGGAARADRYLHIVGTLGEIEGKLESSQFVVRVHSRESFSGTEEVIDVKDEVISNAKYGGHNGGDFAIMHDLIAYYNGDTSSVSLTKLDDSINGHLCVFAADKARKEKSVVIVDEMKK